MKKGYVMLSLLIMLFFGAAGCKDAKDRNTNEVEKNYQEDDMENKRNDYSNEAPMQGVTTDTTEADTSGAY